ncbi:MbcA/ParS/Xre antitoxin family protein [Marinobacter salarius]|jgi:antitoxin Xre/MbcA/ParS-like protein|uniref:MbcA/ParS/Xre antitoxin family protein n=1 Tax=Marinobacter salarius TaxID=1420917 RepID=UPI00300AE3D0|tara:strand:+ start:12737 stop:13069 length:333 start_codon:yes stop_codon:yes gene_type:complete
MDNDAEYVARDIAEQLGVSGDELPEQTLLDNYSREDVIILFEALRNRMVAVIGNDPDNLAHWLRTDNHAFNGRPIDHLGTIEGFRDVIRYLELFSQDVETRLKQTSSNIR